VPSHEAHWRHLANKIELVLPSAHQTPQPKWQIFRFSRFYTADGKISYTLQQAPISPKLPLPMEDLDPHLT